MESPDLCWLCGEQLPAWPRDGRTGDWQTNGYGPFICNGRFFLYGICASCAPGWEAAWPAFQHRLHYIGSKHCAVCNAGLVHERIAFSFSIAIGALGYAQYSLCEEHEPLIHEVRQLAIDGLALARGSAA